MIWVRRAALFGRTQVTAITIKTRKNRFAVQMSCFSGHRTALACILCRKIHFKFVIFCTWRIYRLRYASLYSSYFRGSNHHLGKEQHAVDCSSQWMAIMYAVPSSRRFSRYEGTPRVVGPVAVYVEKRSDYFRARRQHVGDVTTASWRRTLLPGKNLLWILLSTGKRRDFVDIQRGPTHRAGLS